MGPRGKGRKNNNKKKKGSSQQGRVGGTDGDASCQRRRCHDEWNFVREAGPGCHMARPEHGSSTWVLEWEAVDPKEDFEDEEIPDLAVDLEEQTLSLCNVREEPVVAYITIFDQTLRGKDGQILQPGSTTSKEGTTRTCTTLIVLCPAQTFAHLCYIEYDASTMRLEELEMDSDVQVWNRHDNIDDEHPQPIGFPLSSPGPYMCTQGEGGHLTHFFSGNQHAIDFKCSKGTPLLAVGDGVVLEASVEHEHLTGIAVSNLFSWNSILLQLDPISSSVPDDTTTSWNDDMKQQDTLYVEYVHIATASVQKGDRVVKGQIIGTSGGIGFSPEDHLHFAGYRSSEPHAPTVRLCFQTSSDRTIFYPRAGRFYNEHGEVEIS